MFSRSPLQWPRALLTALLLALIGPAGPACSAAPAAQSSPGAAVEVVGTGRAAAKPDLAEIQIGVLSEAPDAASALDRNNRAMRRLQKAIEAHGVQARDVQTGQFSVNPNYRSDKGGPAKLIGYRVSHQLDVTVRKLSDLGALLDAVVQAGANRINAIHFSAADSRALLDRARQRAMADARHRAQVYAAQAGLRLGRVLHIEEQGGHGPRPMQLNTTALRAVPIAPGQVSVNATVRVRFAASPKP